MDNLKENVRAVYTSVNIGPSDLFWLESLEEQGANSQI